MSNISRILHTTQLKLVHVFMLLKKIKRILVFGNTVYKYFVISCVNLKKIHVVLCPSSRQIMPTPLACVVVTTRKQAMKRHAKSPTGQLADESNRRILNCGSLCHSFGGLMIVIVSASWHVCILASRRDVHKAKK